MKNIKKLVASLLLISTVFTLAACGSTSSTSTSGSTDGSQSASETDSDNTEEKDVLRVGMDLKFPPFSYLDDDGNAAGLEPIISEAFAEYLGMEVEIVNTDFSLLIPALDTGDVDILIADMSYTDERAEKADFSEPYRYTNTLALVNTEFASEHGITNDMPEADFFAIEGANFTGLSGTKGVYYPQSFGVNVTEVTEIGTGIVEVTTGISDILVASNEIYGFQAANPETTIVYAGIKDQVGSSFVVKKDNTELLEKANEFIVTMYEEGGLYDQIRAEYDPIVAEFMQNDSLGLDFITDPAN